MDGVVGYGEASLNGQEDAVLAAFKARADLVIRHAAAALPERLQPGICRRWPRRRQPRPLIRRHGIFRRAGAASRLPRRWAGRGVKIVRVYANINRRTRDRSPTGFAASVSAARAAGHEAFKIAPFDEADAERCASGEGREAVAPGLARIAAVHSAIGSRRLMIDCHWRLDATTAAYVIDAAAELGIYWIECPIPEITVNLPAIRALRERANRLGVNLAGCETMVREQGFRPFLEARAYNVIMPDVKYAGGLRTILALEEAAACVETVVSLHNPTGPVCHAVSLQVSAALREPDLLEMQFDETPIFDSLQSRALPAARDGCVSLPTFPGTGLLLDAEAFRNDTVTVLRGTRHPIRNEERNP